MSDKEKHYMDYISKLDNLLNIEINKNNTLTDKLLVAVDQSQAANNQIICLSNDAREK